MERIDGISIQELQDCIKELRRLRENTSSGEIEIVCKKAEHLLTNCGILVTAFKFLCEKVRLVL